MVLISVLIRKLLIWSPDISSDTFNRMIKEARDRHYLIYICRPSEGSDLENIYGKETKGPSLSKYDSLSKG